MTRSKTESMPGIASLATRLLPICVSLLLVVASGCGSSTTANTDSTKPPTPKELNPAIAVLYYDDGSPYCEAFREGVETAAKDRDTAVKWYDASSAEEQSAVLDLAIEENHAAYCICPLAVDILADRSTALKDSGKPVVVMERPLTSEPLSEIDEQIAYVAPDHFYHGMQIRQLASKAFDEDSTIFVVTNDSFVANERLMGIEYSLRDSTTIKLAKSNEAAATTEDQTEETDDKEDGENEQESQPALKTSDSIAESVTEFLKDNDPESVCIVALSIEDLDEVANGKDAAGEDYSNVPVYSFGADGETAEAVKSRVLSATILEDPYTMGLMCVRKIAEGLDGTPPTGLIAPDEHIITSENLDDSRSEHLLNINVRK